jgi:hypothetical protein
MELKFKHFIILQALDVLTTWYGLTFLHLTEANPFANTMFSNMGLINALIAMKIVGLMVIYGILYIYPLNIRIIALKVMCGLFSLVIINNAYQMIRVL